MITILQQYKQTFKAINFAIDNLSALDQVFNAFPVEYVYGFCQPDNGLIPTTRNRLQNNASIFDPFHTYSPGKT